MKALNSALEEAVFRLRARHGRLFELLLATIAFGAFFALYFSPVWLRGEFLAPGDAAIYYMPLYYRKWHLWTDLLLAGYPSIADLQFQINYLPKLLIPTYNAFIISAYVIMAVGMYFFVSAYTKSRLGAIVAALIVSSGGFMVAHLGHATIIHSACWLPWIFWSFNRISVGPSSMAIAVGAFSVGLSLMGGHPQISLIVFMAAAAFWLLLLGESVARGEWKRVGVAGVAIFGLGLMLSAVSVVPFVEFTMQGVRSTWTLHDFDSFSETPRTLLLGVFPNLFGTHAETVYGAYRGPWNLTELAFYAGAGGLALSVMGFWLTPRRAQAWFWASLAVFALFMSMGASTPLGEFVFNVPVIGSFRCQGRYGLVYIFSTAVLVGMLFASPANATANDRGWHRRRIFGGMAVLAIIGIMVLYELMDMLGSSPAPFSTATGFKLAIVIPLMFLAATLASWFAWQKRRTGFLAVLIVALVGLDLASFGMYYEWRFRVLPKNLAQVASSDEALLQEIRQSGTRVLPVTADSMPFGPFKPDSSVMWRIPVGTSYGPLLPERVQTYAAIDTSGNPNFDVAGSPILDVLNIGWLAGPSIGALPSELALSRQCGVNTAARLVGEFVVPPGTRAHSLRIISQLACSTSVTDGSTVAEFIWDGGGVSGNIPLLAGNDTSEWAIDIPMVGPVAHRKATVASTYDYGGQIGHTYVTEKTFPGDQPVAIDGLKVKLTWPSTIGVKIISVEIIGPDGTVAGRILPKVGDGDWKALGTRGIVSRRVSAAPSAWGVCDVRLLPEKDLKVLLQRGEFASGEQLRIHSTALFDDATEAPYVDCKSPPRIESIKRKEGRISMKVTATNVGLVVVSNTYYPGWIAKMDGVERRIVPVDGFIQGIVVPPGTHELKLLYRPTSFIMGGCASLLALIILLLPPLARRFRRRTLPGSRQ